MIFLRSLVFNIWFYGLTFVLAVIGIMPRLITSDPTPPFSMRIARLWSRGALGGLRLICGADYVVTGGEHLPVEGPAVIASMHQSAFDTLVWLTLMPRACYILKQELLRVPLFGTMCRITGMISVDRGAGAGAIRSLMKGADRAVAERRQMVIFPEGTRAAPGEMLKLQPGIAALALRSKLPVIPVATDSGVCWGRNAFHKRPGTIHIAVGAPIPAGVTRDELLRRLEEAFAAGVGGAPFVDNSVGGAGPQLPAH